MSYDYVKTAENARKLILKFGGECIAEVNTKTLIDVNKPFLGVYNTVEEFGGECVSLPVTDSNDIQFIKDSSIVGSVANLLVVCNTTLDVNDVIKYRNLSYKIIKMTELKPAGTTILFDCLAVKVG